MERSIKLNFPNGQSFFPIPVFQQFSFFSFYSVPSSCFFILLLKIEHRWCVDGVGGRLAADLNGFIFMFFYMLLLLLCLLYIFSNEKQALTIERRGLLTNKQKRTYIKRERKKSLIHIHNYDTASSWAKHSIIRL